MILAFLSKHLDIPEANARILYDQWVEQSQMDLYLGKSVTVAGLGSFHMEKGVTVFVADPELELYGNRVYAGLDLLTEDEPPASDPGSDDPITEIIKPKKLPSVPKKVKLDVTPAPEAPADTPPSTPEPVKTAFTLDTQAMAEPEPQPDPSDTIIPQAENPVMEPHIDTDPEPEPEAPPVRKKERAPVAAKPKTNRTAWYIAVPIAVVVLVASWYGIQYASTNMQSEMNEAQVSAPPAAEATPVSEPDPAPVAVPDAASVPATTAATPADSPLASPEYGLRGPLNPLEGRVYGIIVHSLPLKEESDAQCAKISALGLRCSVVEADRNGTPTYRVSIGQFATAADAQTATSELPADYAGADKHFIARIQ
jgi:septal ring-binding cell division protein DamX